MLIGGDRRSTALPVREGGEWRLLGTGGVPYDLPGGASVRLFRPTPRQAPWVGNLQSFLVERGLRQPIPQLAAPAGRLR